MIETDKKSGWDYLIDFSSSSKRDERQIALIRAYSWVEHALGASGLQRGGNSISQLLHQAYNQNKISKGLSFEKIRNAIKIRHEAAHIDTVPSADQCKIAVGILRDTWVSLRKNFVNVDSASDIAHKITSREGILAVNLYGSLAKKSDDPHDIDLLVFDDGRYAKFLEKEDLAYIDRVRSTRKSLKLIGLLSFPINHIVNCRWVDIVILNGKLFGVDDKYTSRIMSCQPDPYFFLNISSDILQYDSNSNSFLDTQMEIFRRLRQIKGELHAVGFNV